MLRNALNRRGIGLRILPVLIATVAGASLTPATQAAAVTPAAVSTARVTGVVVGGGHPLGQASVAVLNAKTGQPLKAATADSAGRFTVAGLPATSVKIRAAKSGWVTTFAYGKYTLVSANVFTLVAGRTTPLGNVVLPRPAAVTGYLWGDFDPILGTVTVYDARTGTKLASKYVSDLFTIGGLPPIPVKLGATSPGWVPQFADRMPTLASATVYSLGAGKTTALNFDCFDLSPESILQGTVRAFGSGAAVGGVRVTAYDAATARWLGSTATNATSGTFVLRQLPEGVIKVKFTKTGWLTGWWHGKTRFATANGVNLGWSATVDLGSVYLHQP